MVRGPQAAPPLGSQDKFHQRLRNVLVVNCKPGCGIYWGYYFQQTGLLITAPDPYALSVSNRYWRRLVEMYR